mmetsp:Transcript_17696/g.55851  ORF Transcript_17696/g.55851 Transcript_17696/m.55851 type:complete len:204 (+) Transcript_17696:669-1280(+)
MQGRRSRRRRCGRRGRWACRQRRPCPLLQTGRSRRGRCGRARPSSWTGCRSGWEGGEATAPPGETTTPPATQTRPPPPSPPAPPRSASLLPQSHSSRGRSSSLRRSERRARSSSTSSRDASSREEASSREGLGPGSRPAPPAVPTQWPAVASPSPLPAAALAREKRDEARRTEWRSSLTMTACWSASRRTVASSAASFATVLA